MSTVVIGVNHRTASVDLLERVALQGEAVGKALTNLTSRSNVREAVVLSTCNRTEIYAIAERYHGAYADIHEFLAELSGLHTAELSKHLYSAHDHDAVQHLFAVAAGLESAVVGESEILGQVHQAWNTAHQHGSARAGLNLLFRHAIETGKRVRTETAIGRGTASVSHAAVEMAADILSGGDVSAPLRGVRATVLGAGEMGDGVAVALSAAGAGPIRVINRSHVKAERLAARIGGTVVPFDHLGQTLADTDLLITCTASATPLVDADTIVAHRLPSSTLLVVDISVPRNVTGDVAALPGVRVLNLDHLREWASRGIELRLREASAARTIVGDEVERYALEATARQAAPLVAELHDHAEQVRQAELTRQASRLADLTDAQRDAVDAITRGVMAKLLHSMTVRLKADAGSPRGDRNAAAVRDLFALDEHSRRDLPEP